MGSKAPNARCDECTLKTQPFVSGYGAPRTEAKLVLIGEAPGYHEVKEGRPFVGPSGQLLQAILPGDYSKTYRTNAVLCRPSDNRNPTQHEMAMCHTRLMKEIEPYACPKVALGRAAMDQLDLNIRGLWEGDRIGAFHPAYILRRPNEVGELHNVLKKALDNAPQDPLDPQVIVTDDPSLIPPLKEPIIFDLETDNVDWEHDEILCMAITDNAEMAWVIPGEAMYRNPHLVQRLLNRYTRIGGHNIKFDQNFLAHQLGVHPTPTIDTFLAHYCLKETSGGHDLKGLSAFHFDAPDYEGELVQRYLKSRNDRYSKVPRDKLYQYAALDVCYNWKLIPVLETEVEEAGLQSLYKHLLRISQAVHEAEQRGIKIDVAHLQAFARRMTEETNDHEASMRQLTWDSMETQAGGIDYPTEELEWAWDRLEEGLNPRSPKQVRVVMFDLLGLPEGTAARKKDRSTDKEVLKHLKGKHPFVDELRMYRKKHKMLSSYAVNLLEAYDDDERVHPDLRVGGTETGRLASFYHTIPRPGDERDELSYLGSFIRRSFVAPEGRRLIVADYSQAELRVAAALSGEDFLLETYAAGRDVHGDAALAVFGEGWTKEQRAIIKMMIFAFIYGGSEYSMSNEFEMPIGEARSYVRKLKGLMPRLAEYREEVFEELQEKGYVETRFGRRRRFPLIMQVNESEARKAAMNMPIQSCANDVTLLSFCKATEAGVETLLSVHDSVMAEADEAEAHAVGRSIKLIMEQVAEEWFPEVVWKVDYDVLERWGE